MKQGISPALDFVISICFQDPEELKNPNPDWGEISRIILGNRILGYALDRLNITFPRPGDIPSEFNEVYRNQALDALLSSGEIAKMNKLASSSGIPVYFYKGPVWSQWLFGDIKMRAPGDIDLFVSREHLLDWIDILKQNGYTIYPYHEMLLNSPGSLQAAFLDSDYHIPLHNYDSSGQVKSVVEAHWRIAYPRLCFDFNPEDFDRYAARLDFLNNSIPVLSNEYQLLMLIVNHGGKEGWNRLKYVVDLKGYLDRYGSDTDWDLVYRLASEKGMTRLLDSSLGIIKALGYSWNTRLPAVKENSSIGGLINSWEKLPPLPKNASWSYFRHAMATRDPSHKLKIIKNHIAFLRDFRLHRQKLRWYNTRDRDRR